MAIGRTNAAKAGLGIDGSQAQYTALSAITQGDLVELTQVYSNPTNAKLTSEDEYIQYFDAVALGGGTIALVRSEGSSKALHLTMLTVQDGQITVGESLRIPNATEKGYLPQARLMSNGNIFITYGTSTSYPTSYCVCKVASGVPSLLATGTLVSSSQSANYSVLTTMADGSLAFIYLYGTSYYAKKITASTTGATISADVRIVSSLSHSTVSSPPAACLMDDGNLLITHGISSMEQAFQVISPTFALLGEATGCADAYGMHRARLVRLGQNKYLAVRSGGSSSASSIFTYARVIYAAGGSLALGAETLLFSAYDRAVQPDCLLLPNGQVLYSCVSMHFSTTPTAHVVLLDIDGSAVSVRAHYNASTDGMRGECTRCVKMDGGEVVLLFSEYNDFYFYGCVLPFSQAVKKGENPTALALEGCAAGETARVFIPSKGA